MATPKLLKCEYIFVQDIERDGNGGVIFNNRNSLSLDVYYCYFDSCHVLGAYYGGVVYFKSTDCTISFRNIFAKQCSSNMGHCSYFDGSSHETKVSYINCFELYGSDRGSICFNDQCPPYARYYNSTSCKTNVHCNFHCWGSGGVDWAYFNFISCESDVLCGIDITDPSNSIFSYANFINNKKNQGLFGLIYTKSNSESIYECRNIYLKENQHILFYAYSGILNIYDSYCDQFTSGQSNGVVNKDNSVIEKSNIDIKLYDFIIFDHKLNTIIHETKGIMSVYTYLFVILS